MAANCTCHEGYTGAPAAGLECEPVLPIAVIIAAAVGGGVAVVALAGYGMYFYGFAQPAAAAVVAAPTAVAASQFSVTNIKVDLVIKTHWA